MNKVLLLESFWVKPNTALLLRFSLTCLCCGHLMISSSTVFSSFFWHFLNQTTILSINASFKCHFVIDDIMPGAGLWITTWQIKAFHHVSSQILQQDLCLQADLLIYSGWDIYYCSSLKSNSFHFTTSVRWLRRKRQDKPFDLTQFSALAVSCWRYKSEQREFLFHVLSHFITCLFRFASSLCHKAEMMRLPKC